MSNLSIKYYNLIYKDSLQFNDVMNNLRNDILELKNKSLVLDFSKFNQINTNRYLRYFNILDLTSINSRYSILKIINSSDMSYDQINNGITSTNVISLMNNIKKTGNTYDETLIDYNFIKNYLIKFSEIYNKNLYIHHYLSNDYYKNFSSLLDSKYDNYLISTKRSTLFKSSFFHILFLKNFLNYIYTDRTNLKNILLTKFNLNIGELLDLSLVYDNSSIYDDVVKIILNNQYQFGKVTDSFIQEISSETSIRNKIDSIVDIFNSYLGGRSNEFKLNLVNSLFDFFIHKSSFDFFDSIFSLQNVFNFISINLLTYKLYSNTVDENNQFRNIVVKSYDYVQTLTDFEDQIISLHEQNLNNFYSIKEYLFSLYALRDNYFKFVNNIDYVISNFVYDNIRPSDIYYFNNFGHLKEFFTLWTECIYFSNFNNKFRNNYEKENLQTLVSDDLVKFILVFELNNIIEDFVKSDIFTEHIYQIQREVFEKIRGHGHINSDFNWCENNTSLNVYYFCYLKDIIFNFDISSISTFLTESIANSSFKIFENNLDFQNTLNTFKDRSTESIYNFYENFLISFVANMFSKAIHSIYYK